MIILVNNGNSENKGLIAKSPVVSKKYEKLKKREIEGIEAIERKSIGEVRELNLITVVEMRIKIALAI